MWRTFGERGWRLGMKWKNASQCEVQLGMEQAKRSRAKRHGAGEGGGQFFFLSFWGGGWAWHRGLEALQGRAGEHLDRRWTCVPFSSRCLPLHSVTTVDSATPTSNRTGLETGA